jgi:hypothetical protein
MKKYASSLLVVAMLFAAAPLLGQRGMGMGMMPPSMSGIWSPVIGAGSVYERVDTKDNTKHLTQIAVISKDTLDGKDGFWLETMNTESGGQQSVVQILMVKDGGQLNFAKIIVQQPGQPPMEISSQITGMMGGRRGGTPPPTSAAVDARATGAIIGKETVTTPAGTFDCEHWKSADGTAESWFSPKVSPWALVKSVTPNSTMTLVKVITDAKSHITGTPVKMEDMMRGRGPGL